MVFNLQQCPLRKNITLQATQPCMLELRPAHLRHQLAGRVAACPKCVPVEGTVESGGARSVERAATCLVCLAQLTPFAFPRHCTVRVKPYIQMARR